MRPRTSVRLSDASGEEGTILADPTEQAVDPFVGADLRPPAEPALRLADVGHEDALVAGAPVGVGRPERAPEGMLQLGDQRAQAQRVVGPAADVEDLALHVVDPRQGALVDVHQVADPEHVADLLAVAENRERLPRRRRHAEPGDPTLILNSKLTRTIDARLSKYNCF